MACGGTAPPDTTGGFRLGRRDAAFGIAAAGVIAVVAANDRAITRQVLASDSHTARRLARWAEQLGSPYVLIPTVAAAWGVAHIAHAPALAAAAVRAGAGIGVAGVACYALKRTVGRARPRESPDDAARFDSFSDHESFPSGHATLAFAAATTLDRETRARWVPFVVYPTAALVGWSRMHDREHWASDILGGAALGFWTAGKTQDFLRARSNAGIASRLFVAPEPGGARAAMMVRF